MGIAESFRALSDPVRRQILLFLKSGPRAAGEIAKAADMTPAALSYHLNLLKKADLVLEYRWKNFIYYELNATLFEDLILWLEQFGTERTEGGEACGEQE